MIGEKQLKQRSPFRALFTAITRGDVSAISNGLAQNKKRKKNGLLAKSSFLQGSSQLLRYLLYALLFLIVLTIPAGIGAVCSIFPPLVVAELLKLICAVFTITLGLFTAINVLFYTGQVEHYLALPIKRETYFKIKLLQYFYYMLFFDLAFAAAFLLPYFILGKPGWDLGLRLAIDVLILFFSSKMILLFICFFVMSSMKWARDKDRFTRIVMTGSLIFGISFGIGSQFFSSGMRGLTDDLNSKAEYAQKVSDFMNSQSPLTLIMRNITNLVCPPGFLHQQIFSNQSSAWAFLAIAIAFTGILTYAISRYSSKRYPKILMSLQSSSTAAVVLDRSSLAARLAARSPRQAFQSVDALTIKRSPLLNTYFKLTPLLMPLYFVAVIVVVGYLNYKQQNPSGGLNIAKELIQRLLVGAPWNSFLTMLLSFVAILSGAFVLNSSASVEFSRDGGDFYVYKTTPLAMRHYLFVKYSRSLRYNYLSSVIMIILALAVLRPSIVASLLIILLTAASCIAQNTLRLIVGVWAADFNERGEEDLTRLLKGGRRMLYDLGGGLVYILPLALIFYLLIRFGGLNNAAMIQGFSLPRTTDGVYTRTILILLAYNLIVALVASSVYFVAGSKKLLKK
ncbi:MAG: hypothetical protein Q4P72_04900 [Eubacteriales bacterium]|nr:hypothetical protein [Eubacteriales bacterium]